MIALQRSCVVLLRRSTHPLGLGFRVNGFEAHRVENEGILSEVITTVTHILNTICMELCLER